MTIKEFGGKVASVWEGLRPVTKKMLVGALKTGDARAAQQRMLATYQSYHVKQFLTAFSIPAYFPEKS